MKKFRKKSFGRCIHCLKETLTINKDHVFPKAWYPDSTPANVQRWTAPSCIECNSAHGKNEQGLLTKLGLCISPIDAKSSGISEKVLKSLNVNGEYGRNDRDNLARRSQKIKIFNELQFTTNPPTEGQFPNFESNTVEPVDGKYMVVPIDEKSLLTLARKIVRGITYCIENRYIEENEEVFVSFNRDIDIPDIIFVLNKFGESIAMGPGFKVIRALAEDSPKACLFRIEIWGKLVIYAATLPKSG